ncbi:MAG: PQQ-binding-like beta-propeller repeat protein, partial [Pseudomonadota bacterium]
MRFSFLSSRLLSVPARPLRTAFGVVGLVMVAGCSGGPLGGGLFGGDDTTEIDLNDDGRIPVLALEDIVKADARYAGLSVSTPPSYVNNSWPQPGGEADHTLHHLSAELGFDLAWQADVGKASNRLELVLAPPVIADGKVYVVDAEAKVSAFDEEDGSLVWRTELTQDVSERFRLQE